MENFFNFSSFQWKFLGLNLAKSACLKFKFLQYLIYFVHIVQIVIYGFTRSYSKFTDFIKIGDLISGLQVVIFSAIMLVKYVAIFKNQKNILKITQLLPQKINKDAKFKRFIQESLHAYLIYGSIIAFFAILYLIYIQINLNFKITGGLWCPPGSDLTKRLFYIYMIILNIAVLTVWIYCEILKYGLISVTTIEYQRLKGNFIKFVQKLKIKIRKNKKVRFSKLVDIEGRKVKLKKVKNKESSSSDSSSCMIDPIIGAANLDINIVAPVRIVQAPFFRIFLSDDLVAEDEGSKSSK